MDYMIEANPEETQEDDWAYTDTDSLCMPSRAAQRIARYNGGKMGDIDDDPCRGARVLKASFIAPKLYEIWYALPGGTPMKGGKVARDGEVYRKFAAKGLEKRDLSTEKFIAMAGGGEISTTKAFTFKKIGFVRNKKQAEIPMFSIVMSKRGFSEEETQRLTRVANKTPWIGRVFEGNGSVPKGWVQ